MAVKPQVTEEEVNEIGPQYAPALHIADYLIDTLGG
jgi:hypothetical protein